MKRREFIAGLGIAAAAWPRLVSGEFATAELTAEPGMVLGRQGLGIRD